MILGILLGCLAAALLLGGLAWKLKKYRAILAVCAVVALLPALWCGSILAGVGYPGEPTAVVEELAAALSEGDIAAAESTMLGSLGLTGEDASGEVQMLLEAMTANYTAKVKGRCVVDELTGSQTLVLTHLDMEAWQKGLQRAVEAQLYPMVQQHDAKDVFTADGEDYLPELKEEAYALALETHLKNTASFVTETELEVTLGYTPFGWVVLPDAALLNALAGCTVAEEGVVFNGDIAGALGALLESGKPVVLDNLELIPKIQMLAEDALMGEVPDPDGFGASSDPQDVLEVIAEAEWLLGGQTLAWNPDLELKPESEIRWYLDDSILVIVWQEVHDTTVCSFAEVKVANGTQIRRGLSYDTYFGSGSNPRSEQPTKMAKRMNAVVALSGDFYRYRVRGINVYQGVVERNEPRMLDSLLIDRNGDFVYAYRNQLQQDEVEAFVTENDITFSVAFGPVLIDNGEKVELPQDYTLGEIFEGYDRVAIGQLDTHHYLLMTVAHERYYYRPGVLANAQNYMYEKGCKMAYTLDGGQTTSLVFNGELVNKVNYGGERFMSDIIYFASAMPEQGDSAEE